MSLQHVADPSPPGPGLVLLEVEAVGICGSDYSLYLGKHPLSQFPQIQGHEFAARVAAYGPDTQRRLPIGNLVAVEPLLPCGHCYPCSLGRYNCCVDLQIIGVHVAGALQRYVTVPEHLLHDAEGLAPEVAAFAEPMSIALQGLKRGAVTADDSVLIIGAGPVGQAAIIAATDIGAKVAAADLLPSRLERAAAIGAELTVDSRQDVASAMADWTNGQGPTFVMDASGAPPAIALAVDVVAAAGRVVLVGISDKEVTLPVAVFTRKELTVLGSRNSAGIFNQAVDLVRRHSDKVQTLISHRIGLAEVPDTIALALRQPDVVEKVVVRISRQA